MRIADSKALNKLIGDVEALSEKIEKMLIEHPLAKWYTMDIKDVTPDNITGSAYESVIIDTAIDSLREKIPQIKSFSVQGGKLLIDAEPMNDLYKAPKINVSMTSKKSQWTIDMTLPASESELNNAARSLGVNSYRQCNISAEHDSLGFLKLVKFSEYDSLYGLNKFARLIQGMSPVNQYSLISELTNRSKYDNDFPKKVSEFLSLVTDLKYDTLKAEQGYGYAQGASGEPQKQYLYSPLNVSVRYKDNLECYDENDYWRDEISSREAVGYIDEMNAAIEKDRIRSGEKSGLMDYFDCDSKMMENSIKGKVISAYPAVKEINGEVFGVMEMEVRGSLNNDEIDELKDYFTGQYSDGWGEGFEQREIKTSDGDMYVEFWSSDKFYIDTASEFQDRTGIELEPADYTEPGMTQEM